MNNVQTIDGILVYVSAISKCGCFFFFKWTPQGLGVKRLVKAILKPSSYGVLFYVTDHYHWHWGHDHGTYQARPAWVAATLRYRYYGKRTWYNLMCQVYHLNKSDYR
jgi:hypothetical protein